MTEFNDDNLNNDINNNLNNDINNDINNDDIKWCFKCYSEAFSGKDLNKSDQILVPNNILNSIANNKNIEYPLFFKITFNNKSITCGMLEFTDDDNIYMPFWLMQNLYPIREGDLVFIEIVNIPNADIITVKPHDMKFLLIEDHKKVLEENLSKFTTINKGSTIAIYYKDVPYELNIVDTKPSDSVSIINTDVKIDFEEPVDYVDQSFEFNSNGTNIVTKKPRLDNDKNNNDTKDEDNDEFVPFSGKGYKLGNK